MGFLGIIHLLFLFTIDAIFSENLERVSVFSIFISTILSSKGKLRNKNSGIWVTVYIYVCIDITIYMCIYIFIYIYISICIYVFLYIYLSVYLSICIFAYLSICISISLYTTSPLILFIFLLLKFSCYWKNNLKENLNTSPLSISFFIFSFGPVSKVPTLTHYGMV